jgi:hypothetical protein
MADEVIKKVNITNASLPPLNSETLKYDIKYRVVSEDKKLFSHWSPIVSVDPGYSFVSGNINISSSGSVVNVVWDPVQILIGTKLIRVATEYDLWFKWSRNNSDGDWIKSDRMPQPNCFILHPTNYTINGVSQGQVPNRLTVEVYLVGEPVTRDFTGLRVYNPAMHTI